MVVRTTNRKGQVTFTNIRHLMENETLPELHHYDLSLGAATTKTATQKALTKNAQKKWFTKQTHTLSSPTAQ